MAASGEAQTPRPAVLRAELRRDAVGPVRVPVREDIPPDVVELLSKLSQGRPVHAVFRTLAHSPTVAKRIGMLAGALFAKCSVAPREREVVVLRMAWRCGSVYEFGEHTTIGLDAGLSHEEIRALTADDCAGLADADAALAALVDELYDANAVSAGTWDRLAASWSQQQLVDYLVIAGFYWMMACVLNGARVEPEAGSPGWPADLVPSGLS
jgi:4-carboxymuconolactone decarboxylase